MSNQLNPLSTFEISNEYRTTEIPPDGWNNYPDDRMSPELSSFMIAVVSVVLIASLWTCLLLCYFSKRGCICRKRYSDSALDVVIVADLPPKYEVAIADNNKMPLSTSESITESAPPSYQDFISSVQSKDGFTNSLFNSPNM